LLEATHEWNTTASLCKWKKAQPAMERPRLERLPPRMSPRPPHRPPDRRLFKLCLQ